MAQDLIIKPGFFIIDSEKLGIVNTSKIKPIFGRSDVYNSDGWAGLTLGAVSVQFDADFLVAFLGDAADQFNRLLDKALAQKNVDVGWELAGRIVTSRCGITDMGTDWEVVNGQNKGSCTLKGKRPSIRAFGTP